MYKYTITFTLQQVLGLKQVYKLVDARYGGLVLGRRHSDGGVKMLKPLSGNTFGLCEMEGGEFLTCSSFVSHHLDYLQQANSYFDENEGLSDDYDGHLFNIIRPLSSPYLLILSDSDQFIINRSATKKYLHDLDRINRECVLHELQEKKYLNHELFNHIL